MVPQRSDVGGRRGEDAESRVSSDLGGIECYVLHGRLFCILVVLYSASVVVLSLALSRVSLLMYNNSSKEEEEEEEAENPYRQNNIG